MFVSQYDLVIIMLPSSCTPHHNCDHSKWSTQIDFIFNMYIDMGERIAGKQDEPSQIIRGPLKIYIFHNMLHL